MNEATDPRPPLSWADGRLHVLEVGRFIAGPFAGTLFGDMGADVIKIEAPEGGDPMRSLPPGPAKDGMGFQWAVDGRNKRSTTLNLKSEEGRDILRELVRWADVLIENNIPGVMAGWQLSYEDLARINPRLVYVSVSGYGHGNARSGQPAFDFVGSAMSGLTYSTGFPDRPPVLPGYAIIDFTTGAFAAIGALEALRRRDGPQGTGRGEWIDIALYEPALRFSAAMIPDYMVNGTVRQRDGSEPSGDPEAQGKYWGYVYETRDGQFVSVNPVGHSDKAFCAMLQLIGQSELAQDARLADKLGRIRNARILDAALRVWVHRTDYADAASGLAAAGVPYAKIYNVADLCEDPIIRTRNLVSATPPEGGDAVPMMGVIPRFMGNPGEVRWSGERLGGSNDAVYGELLGYDTDKQADLARRGVI